MTSQNVNIPQFYEQGDIDYLFDNPYYNYERLYATTFASRKSLNIDEAMKLAMELPTGAFVAGSFVRLVAAGQPIKLFDVFFAGPDGLKALVRRIQNAPEGSYLHGYTSFDSVRSLGDGNERFMTFNHPTKPTLRLVRVRWYSRPEECIDKFDVTVDQFAIDSELNVIFRNDGLNDIRSRIVRLLNTPFPTATGFKLRRMMDSGWAFSGDTYLRDDWLRRIRDHNRTLERAGKPIPENVEGHVAFEP